MLAELEIENLAVIAHARIPFSPRLNVFTGETGAGFSPTWIRWSVRDWMRFPFPMWTMNFC